MRFERSVSRLGGNTRLCQLLQRIPPQGVQRGGGDKCPSGFYSQLTQLEGRPACLFQTAPGVDFIQRFILSGLYSFARPRDGAFPIRYLQGQRLSGISGQYGVKENGIRRQVCAIFIGGAGGSKLAFILCAADFFSDLHLVPQT